MDETLEKEAIFGIKAKKELGFQTIEKLKEQEIFDDSYEIIREGDFLWLPVKGKIKEASERSFKRKKSFPNLRKEFGIRSFDIIGDIIIIFLPDNLVSKELEIGEYFMKKYPSIKAVYRKIGLRKETLRIQKLKLISGQGSETTHFENGLEFKLDITKVFFSPRQVSERMELTKYVSKNDRVCVFFSGIGPIPIYLASFSEAKRIVAIELNEVAHNYAEENIRLNNTYSVELICGDIKEVIPSLQKNNPFDTVIMPLPKHSDNHIPFANKILKTSGKLILYKIGNEEIIRRTTNELEKEKYSIVEIKKGINVSPIEWRYQIITKKR